MKYFATVAVLALPLGFLSVAAFAEDAKNEKMTDDMFVQKVSECGLAEVQAAKTALKQSQREDVKQFAQKMLDDHTQANQQLSRLADQKKWTVASAVNNKQKQMCEKLAGLRGEEFDREYIKEQKQGHKRAIAWFEAESKNGQDNDLRQWATKTLPTLKEHEEMVRKLDKSGDR